MLIDYTSVVCILITVAQAVKKYACNAGAAGSIPRLGRSPGGGNDNPL